MELGGAGYGAPDFHLGEDSYRVVSTFGHAAFRQAVPRPDDCSVLERWDE
jgi:hypothetical protein